MTQWTRFVAHGSTPWVVVPALALVIVLAVVLTDLVSARYDMEARVAYIEATRWTREQHLADREKTRQVMETLALSLVQHLTIDEPERAAALRAQLEAMR